MATKSEYIEIFNAMIRGTPVSFQEKLFPMVSEYLTEIKYENLDKIINLLVQNPQLIQNFLPEMVKYYCKKYCILSVVFNNKILLYYE
jgi:hypothetical protein